MKAVILAAGKGTRLLPLTRHTPKPLIGIAKTPIIDRIFQSLPDGIMDVIIVVQHLREKIISHVGTVFYDRPVRYVDQLEKGGTFGALLSAKSCMKPGERYLVLNGDDIHDRLELEKHLVCERSFGVQLMKMMPNYHSIHLDANGYVNGLYEQTEAERTNGAFVATGAYVTDTNVFEHPGIALRNGELGLPQTLFAQKDSYPLKGITTTKWIPINSLADLENANALLKEG